MPLIRARLALRAVAPDETLVVLATDPEAPIDLAALAADEDREFAQSSEDGVWRLELSPRRAG
jgi:tRNA 2-thiouridine synthesizing protein A